MNNILDNNENYNDITSTTISDNNEHTSGRELTTEETAVSISLDEIDTVEVLSQVASHLVEEPIKPKPILRMKHISHLDLDGYGSTILSDYLKSLYPEDAMILETCNILPTKLYAEVEDTLTHGNEYDIIIITDLAVNNKLVDLIKTHPSGNKVHVFDHHICELTDLPSNITVTTQSPIHPGKLTCATELYYNFIKNDKIYSLIHDANIKRAISHFVECIRVYDTFEFWGSRMDADRELDISYSDAPRLNTMFHIMERDEFKEYIFKYLCGFIPWESLTVSTPSYSWLSKILQMEQNKNAKYVETAIRRLVKAPFKYDVYRNGKIHSIDYMMGIVFAEKSSPVIANTALERHEDLDLCAVASNNQISVYSNRPEVDVSKIAKVFGGGGHKEAAGFTIPYINSAMFNLQHFASMIECAGNMIPGQITFEDIDVSDTN